MFFQMLKYFYKDFSDRFHFSCNFHCYLFVNDKCLELVLFYWFLVLTSEQKENLLLKI